MRATRKPTESLDAYDYYLRASGRYAFPVDARTALIMALGVVPSRDRARPLDFAAAYGPGVAMLRHSQGVRMDCQLGWRVGRMHAVRERSSQAGQDDADRACQWLASRLAYALDDLHSAPGLRRPRRWHSTRTWRLAWIDQRLGSQVWECDPEERAGAPRTVLASQPGRHSMTDVYTGMASAHACFYLGQVR